MMKANFDLNYLSYFKYPEFYKNVPTLQNAWVEADKRANNQVETVLLDTLYKHLLKKIWKFTS